MKLFITLIYIGYITCVLCPRAYASEEEFLTWKKISAEFSNGVSIEVEADGPIYKKFVIKAFNKSFELNQEDLNEIEGLSLSLLNVTHEAGYEEVGGHTVYFRLSNYLFAKSGEKIKTGIIRVQENGVSIDIDYIEPPEL